VHECLFDIGLDVRPSGVTHGNDTI
jgi:hypothetical protein